jgi:hypothetical protein
MMMEFDTFKSSLIGASPPAGVSGAMQALWWQAKGDWHKAHRCAQADANENGAWAHAYLHRVEGDERNAGGWYKRAGKTPSTASLDSEWEEIARALLQWLFRGRALVFAGRGVDWLQKRRGIE